jgi:hypothetical protein
MRSRSIKKAPPRRRRPSSEPTAGAASELSGNAAGELNVRAAAARALLASVADTPFDFLEELPSDVGFKAGGRVKGDGDSIGDGLFEPGKIRNDRVEGQPIVRSVFHVHVFLHGFLTLHLRLSSRFGLVDRRGAEDVSQRRSSSFSRENAR